MQCWLEATELYGHWWGWKDVCWHHGERPSVIAFTGAVWKLGGVVIQEFNAPKRNLKGSTKADVISTWDYRSARNSSTLMQKRNTCPFRLLNHKKVCQR